MTVPGCAAAHPIVSIHPSASIRPEITGSGC